MKCFSENDSPEAFECCIDEGGNLPGNDSGESFYGHAHPSNLLNENLSQKLE